MFDATKFDRVDPGTGTVNPEGSEYVIELAEMQYAVDGEFANRMAAPPPGFVLMNCPQSGMHRSFHFVTADKSGGILLVGGMKKTMVRTRETIVIGIRGMRSRFRLLRYWSLTIRG